MPQPDVARKGEVSLYPILSVNFVGTLGFSIVLPFLVFLVTKWGGNALVYGLIGATYSVFQLIGAPILGRWSDVHGRRKILLLSQAGTLISWLVFLVAFALPVTPVLNVEGSVLGAFTITVPLIVLFIARAADGLTGGNISVATAYLADISHDEDRNANFGKLSVSSNLGFILGPALAGLLGATVYGEVLPVIAAALISLAATLLIVFRLPESSPCEALHRDPDKTNLRRVFGGEHKPCFDVKHEKTLTARQIVALPGVSLLLTIYFLVMLGFNFFYISFPMHAVTGLAWDVTTTGIFFGVLSAMMALVQGPVLGRVSRRVADTTLVLAGSFILGVSFLFFMSSSMLSIYTGVALLALGNGLMWPSVVSVLSKRAGSRYQGAVQGFASSSGAVASIMGLLVGGMLFDIVGANIFIVSAAIILGVFALSFTLRGKPVQPQAAPASA